MNNGSDVRRVNRHCVEAIEDIIAKVKESKETKGFELSFSDASWLLGEKYFRKNLGVISYDEINRRYGRKMSGIAFKKVI